MLFNSYIFLIFFVITYLLYLFSNHKTQNRLLLVASYFFYGWWDWRFLSLLWVSTGLDFFFALKMDEEKREGRRKTYLVASVALSLAILGFFKYFNFFSENLVRLARTIGWHLEPALLNIILPVGISFYTFQTMGYVIDVYRKALKPTRNFIDFALFVSYFPQLVAGPIERATHLLPQISCPRRITMDGFYEGCFLIFWGLYQKVFVADNLARFVDSVFSSDVSSLSPVLILLAAYAFAFQIYCDFAGYSNMARGLAKLMGFEIMVNFNFPYFSEGPMEFWRRWHISLFMV